MEDKTVKLNLDKDTFEKMKKLFESYENCQISSGKIFKGYDKDKINKVHECFEMMFMEHQSLDFFPKKTYVVHVKTGGYCPTELERE